MKCESCGEREAVIHLTQIVDNTVTTLHLCEQCAAEKGVDTAEQVAKYPLGDFLATLGEGMTAAAAGAGTPEAGDLAALRERLRRAIEAEDFEEAARLRDAIRGLE